MPLASIVQPIMWSYGDCLHCYPHPDILVLADECEDYSYNVPVNGHKTTFEQTQSNLGTDKSSDIPTVTVVNPGNFSNDRSFMIIYPEDGEVQPSKVPN